MSNKLIALFISSLLFGCGSSDDSDEPEPQAAQPATPVVEDPAPTVSQGIFIDSAVIGIGYRTETQSGVTDDEGNYSYQEGESVTFFIGDLIFPATPASGVVTPFNIAASENVDDDQVVNIARLLQTLDKDGDTSNGITITETAIASAEPVDFSLDTTEFAQTAAVSATIENGGQDTTVTNLVDETEAVDHLTEQVASNGVQIGIIGTWMPVENESDLLTLVFFNDGTYTHFEVDSEDEELSGMEWGTYTRDSETGRVITSQMFDQNNHAGLTDFSDETGAAQLFAEITDEQLVTSFDEDADGSIDDSLIFDTQTDDGIVGTWLVQAIDDQLADDSELLMFIFNSDGSYIHGGIREEGEVDESGMEWGTYSIDSETNQATVTQTFDKNSFSGLSDFSVSDGGNVFISAQGNTLLLKIDEDNDGTLDTQLSFQRQ